MSELVPIIMPRENVSDESVLIVKWVVADGTWVETDQVVAEVETSKALVDVHSPGAGYLKHVEPAGTEVAIGAALAFLAPTPDTALPSSAPEAKEKRVTELPVSAVPGVLAAAPLPESTALPPLAAGPARFSPAAQALIEQHCISPHLFVNAGLVRAKEVMRMLSGNASPATQRGIATEDAPKLDDIPRLHRKRLPHKKRVEVKHLSWAIHHALPSNVSTNCATRGLRDILARQTDGVVTPVALIVFEAGRLLRKYPSLNAISLGEEVGYYEDVDVGIAMDDGRGLVVPVVRHADRKTLFEIGEELRELTVTFVDGKLTTEQLSPGTFTLTDLSAFGTSQFQPMINRHQSAILGICAEQFLPGQELGFFTLTLTFDHSVAEGRTGALFLSELKEHIGSYEQTVADDAWAADAHCARCLRTAAQLRQLHEAHVLVRSEVPKGMICSLCLAGY